MCCYGSADKTAAGAWYVYSSTHTLRTWLILYQLRRPSLILYKLRTAGWFWLELLPLAAAAGGAVADVLLPVCRCAARYMLLPVGHRLMMCWCFSNSTRLMTQHHPPSNMVICATALPLQHYLTILCVFIITVTNDTVNTPCCIITTLTERPKAKAHANRPVLALLA